MFDTLIDYIQAHDAALMSGAILVFAIIFPEYMGVHFNGEIKPAGDIDRILVRIGAVFMLLCLLLVFFVFEN